MSKEHEERQRALEAVISWAGGYTTGTRELEGDCIMLEKTVAIPAEEYAMLRRALWVGMQDMGFPKNPGHNPEHQIAGMMLVEADMLDYKGNWTPTAVTFAQEMKDGEGK